MPFDGLTWGLILFAAGAAIAALLLLRRSARMDKRLRGPRKIVMEIPPANETRKSIQRFHEAILRMELVEFAWRKLGPGGLGERERKK